MFFAFILPKELVWSVDPLHTLLRTPSFCMDVSELCAWELSLLET